MMVKPSPGQKIAVRALLNNLAMVDHDDIIGIPDGAQAVRDDKAGPPLHQAVRDDKAGPPLHQAQQRLLDTRLGTRVNTRGRLIKDQDGRVGQNGPSNRQKLALPLTEVACPLREHRLVGLGQLADKVIRMMSGARVPMRRDIWNTRWTAPTSLDRRTISRPVVKRSMFP